MLFSEIKPYIRYARYLKLSNKSKYASAIPYDARLFYTKEGSGTIAVMNQKFEMKKGSALLINSSIKYSIKTPQNSVTYIAFNFDYTQSASHIQIPINPASDDEYEPANLTEHIGFTDTTQFNNYVYIPDIMSIEKTAEVIVSEHTKKLINYEFKSSCLFSQILIEILRHLQLPASQDSSATEKVIDFIHNNYELPITNSDIANKFGFHPNYLSNLIKTSTGLPMHKYILQVRLMHAIELLETGVFSVSEIAVRCGFCDVYHFSRYFKEVMKITPSQFSKMIIKK